MKWRIIGNNYHGYWHEQKLHPIEWHLNNVLSNHKPITINIICKNTNTKREVYDWLFQRYNVKLGITYLIRNIGGKEYMHTQNTKQGGTR